MSITTLTAAKNASRNQGRRPWPKRKLSTRQNDDRFAGHRGSSAKKALAARRMPSGTERYEISRSPASRARHIASDNRGHGRGSQLAGAATSGFENIDDAPARLRDEGWHLR